jgi:AcrR family transcriptional regulator
MVDVKVSRKDRAAATRRRILGAAHDLFTSAGYPGATMAAIADAAGVAVQTVYFTFHTKAELLGEVFEHAVFGDTGEPPQQHSWYRAAQEAEDLDTALRTWADGVAGIVARVAPLRPVFDGVGPDQDVIALWERGERLREEAYGTFLDQLVEHHGLAPGADRDELVDVALVLLGPVGHRGFVEDRRWSIIAWVDFSVQALRQRFP